MRILSRKRQFRGVFSFLFALALFLGGGQHALAQNATIEELIVTNSSADLLLFLTVNNAFTKQMEEGIKNGIPVTFNFYVKLERKRNAWLNQELVSLRFDHTLSYDTLKEEYSIVCSELPGQTFRTKSLAEAKKNMAQLNGPQISPLKALLPEPSSLGPVTKGKTCIGCLIDGIKDGRPRKIFIYNVCDHQECYREVGSQAISYTTGVPAMIGAMLMLDGVWRGKGVFNVEELDPTPFMEKLMIHGLPWQVLEL